MADYNQDFLTYNGDNASPIFLVTSDGTATGTPVDISTVSQITWSARRNLQDAVAATKSKSGGGITFPSGGTDGRFQVKLTPTDTNGLTGWYIHYASITDNAGNVTTVAVGRMNVGLAPAWTWDPGSVGIEPLYTVRQLIGDTIAADMQLTDQQILWALGQYSNEWLAAAECARDLVAFYSRQVDVVQGELKTNYSQRAKTYRLMASDLEMRGMARGGVTAYAGGTSLSDKQNQVLNIDRTPPQFLIGMFDNLLPESPVGHQAGAGQDLPSVSDSGSGTIDVQGGP